MPVKCKRGKPRYRVKTTKTGKRIRLAFCNKKVVEAKKLKPTKKVRKKYLIFKNIKGKKVRIPVTKTIAKKFPAIAYKIRKR